MPSGHTLPGEYVNIGYPESELGWHRKVSKHLSFLNTSASHVIESKQSLRIGMLQSGDGVKVVVRGGIRTLDIVSAQDLFRQPL